MDFEDFWKKETGPDHFAGLPAPKDLARTAWNRATELEREAHDYTKEKLDGALAALRQLQECVPPKDWKRYASEVLALDARDRERSNVERNRPSDSEGPR